MDALPGASFDFLFQSIKLRRGEEFSERDVQTIANLFNGQDFGIDASSVKDILHRRRRQSAHRCEFVDRNIAFCAEHENSILNCRDRVHTIAVLPLASI